MGLLLIILLILLFCGGGVSHYAYRGADYGYIDFGGLLVVFLVVVLVCWLLGR